MDIAKHPKISKNYSRQDGNNMFESLLSTFFGKDTAK